ncbi:hypothetical protein O0L34_g1260 [Tuta absoluta]|nr:hypothetical protein O0L34_g1260 [Tuta absoluta]
MYQSPRPPRMPFNQAYRMQNHHQNPNFAPRPRVRGPRYGYNPNFYGPPPTTQSPCEDYWCETCDRGFSTQNQLDTHKQQHQKCNIDGCQFVAHPKVVTKHIQMQHSTGLFKKIANLNNPEEIRKWREERKRRFPTKENVEKKAAEVKEKIERGEKMGLQKNRHFNNDQTQKKRNSHENGGYDSKRMKTQNNNITDSSNNKRRHRKPKKQVPEKQIQDSNRKLKPFAGILNLVKENYAEIREVVENDLIEDDDDEDFSPQVKPLETSTKPEEPVVCSALSTLMCEYGSSDDENEMQVHQNEPTTTENIKKVIKIRNMNSETGKPNTGTSNVENKASVDNSHNNINTIKQETKVIHHVKEIKNKSDNEAPQEVKVEKPLVIIDDSKDTKTKSNMNRQTRNRNDAPNRKPKNNFKRKLPSTLLQKLLHKEIQQERNIILQCVRHIVKNNYYDM